MEQSLKPDPKTLPMRRTQIETPSRPGFQNGDTGSLELQEFAFSSRLINRFEECYGAAAFASIYR